MEQARRDQLQPSGTGDVSRVAIELREARRGDELAVAELHVRSWQEAYRELMPAEFLAALDPRERAKRYEFGMGGEEAPTTLLATVFGEEGVGDDPSLTDSVEVRSGSSPTPFERIIGFATFGASRDADAVGLAEIYALYVDPDRYRGGVGRMLMADARRRLREGGFDAAVLWVLRGNGRAQRFYEGEGWTLDGAQRFEQPYGIVSDVIRFRRTLD
jgi:ribosomal protein S18 acetylase RimI-like enzyme